jgi:hypothetical protein
MRRHRPRVNVSWLSVTLSILLLTVFTLSCPAKSVSPDIKVGVSLRGVFGENIKLGSSVVKEIKGNMVLLVTKGQLGGKVWVNWDDVSLYHLSR